ncbi:hypothetical protein YC2023_095202 [Brassica napus]
MKYTQRGSCLRVKQQNVKKLLHRSEVPGVLDKVKEENVAHDNYSFKILGGLRKWRPGLNNFDTLLQSMKEDNIVTNEEARAILTTRSPC